MTDVVLSEPLDTQSLMSITREGSDGGGAVFSASHAARVRKVRPSQLKGKRSSDVVENRSMTQKPKQHKDYLSEQRSKRLGKPKVRGREGGARKSRIKHQEKEQKKEEEKEEEKENVAAMNEANEADSRLISAGSNSSKDEGISSNGEKEEELETEEGMNAAATSDEAQNVPGEPEDDDEGRGSIKDEGEEIPEPFNYEVPTENEGEENLLDETPANDESEAAAPHPDPEEQETLPQDDSETVLEEDANGYNGYSGDMDEPNSLAASHQEVVGLSAAAGEDTVDDASAMNTVEDAVGEREENGEGLEEKSEELTSEEQVANLEEEKEDATLEGEVENETEEKEEVTLEEKVENETEEKEEATEEKVESEENKENNETAAEEQTEELQQPIDDDVRKEEEEEIKEIPALAKISGRQKPKNVTINPRIQEPVGTRTPRRKSYDASKVMANRKPISWRPGPIQATANTSETSKLAQKKFKAKMPMEGSVVEEREDGEVASHDVEEDHEGHERAVEEGEISGMELMVPLNLDTFRSEGHIESMTEEETPLLEKSESLPELRPSTAGRKNKIYRRRKARPRINSTWKKNELPEDYTKRWSMLQPGTHNSTSEVWVPEENRLYVYTYSSEPRLLHVRRMGSRRGVVTTDKDDHDPNSSFRIRYRGNGNPMYDRRVVRGSNYAKRLSNEDLPKWNPYFTNARSLENIKPEPETNLRRQEFREKLEARARLRRESHGMSSLYPSHATHARPRAHSHAYVQTENYYEPLERPPEAEVGLQTDAWGDDGFPPPVVFQSPATADMATQVFEDELYEGDEGEVAVAALVARTLREATLEVLEEEQAEEERLNHLREALLHKVSSVGEEQQENNSLENEREDAVEGQEDKEENEEREDPDGKETSPLDTQEPARSPELNEDLVKGVAQLEENGTAEVPVPDSVPESESVAV